MLIETKYYYGGKAPLTKEIIYEIAGAIFGGEKPRITVIKFPHGMKLEENIDALNGRELSDMEQLVMYGVKNTLLPEKVSIYRRGETVVRVEGAKDVAELTHSKIRQLLGL